MSEVTRILSAIEQGDPHAAEQLLPLVYEELRKLAAQKLAQEKPGRSRSRAKQRSGDTGQLLYRTDRIIPMWMDGVRCEVELLHVFLRDRLPLPDRKSVV